MEPDDLECAEGEQCRSEADGDRTGAGGSANEPDGADDPERPDGGEQCCADDPASAGLEAEVEPSEGGDGADEHLEGDGGDRGCRRAGAGCPDGGCGAGHDILLVPVV